MATRKGFPRRARLVWTLPIQNLNVQRKFPQFRYSKHRECGMWSGWLQPTDFSPKYAVQVQYEVDDIPKVHVLSPILHPKQSTSTPIKGFVSSGPRNGYGDRTGSFQTR